MSDTRLSDPPAIGRYVVEQVLGRGAMGVVYAAHDPVIDRHVAIKLVRADLLEGEDRAEYIVRFQQEARAAGRCTHPNIVAVYDFALHEGNPYIAMEFVRGHPLSRVDRTKLAVREAVEIVAQALDGLAAAHALGVTHRDIKPANIMLADDGRVKVTDFGISRLDSASITGAGAVVGTPSYMSPEQCRGEPVGPASDLFSAGVVLYELLTGQKPFAGKTQQEVWRRLLEEEPPDPATLRADLPASVLAALHRALAKPQDQRFATAAEMAAALRGRSAELDADRTVLAPRVKPASEIRGLDLDGSTINAIERQLARHVGPIAGYLVRNAAQNADSLESLYRTLAAKIERAEDRATFDREAQASLEATSARAAATFARSRLDEAVLERARLRLTPYIGPIARVLVKRAAVGCADPMELWRRLGEHVEKPADRAAFLREGP